MLLANYRIKYNSNIIKIIPFYEWKMIFTHLSYRLGFIYHWYRHDLELLSGRSLFLILKYEVLNALYSIELSLQWKALLDRSVKFLQIQLHTSIQLRILFY